MFQADCQQALALLTHLNNDELDEIMNDDSRIEGLLQDLNQCQIKELEVEKEMLIASNKSLAEYNLAKEPELVEGRELIQEKSSEGEELSKLVQEKMKDLSLKNGDTSLETALALLQTAAAEMEEESDKIGEKFLANEMELDEFLEQFASRRKLMHLRLVKAEKMSKLVKDQTSNVPGYINAPPLSINTNYFPNVTPSINPMSAPYPTGPLQMPMPGMPVPNYFPY